MAIVIVARRSKTERAIASNTFRTCCQNFGTRTIGTRTI